MKTNAQTDGQAAFHIYIKLISMPYKHHKYLFEVCGILLTRDNCFFMKYSPICIQVLILCKLCQLHTFTLSDCYIRAYQSAKRLVRTSRHTVVCHAAQEAGTPHL